MVANPLSCHAMYVQDYEELEAKPSAFLGPQMCAALSLPAHLQGRKCLVGCNVILRDFCT